MSITLPASVGDQLQQLVDRQEITDLITRLGLMLDERRYEEVSSILADDVTVQTPGGSASGPGAVVDQARRNHTVRTQHVITDVLVTLRGNHAEAGANLLVTFVPDSDEPGSRLLVGDAELSDPRLMLGERYRFEAIRGDLGWRLRAIEVTRIWSTQPVPTGSRVAQSDGVATTVGS